MTSAELVHALTADLAPVRRLRPPGMRVAGWISVAAGSIAAGLALFGVRHDLVRQLDEARFVGENAALLLAGIGAASCVFRLAIPGAGGGPLAPLAGLAAWIALVGRRWSPDAQAALLGWSCVARMLALGLVPAVAIAIMVGRAAPLAPAWTAGLAALSASALAMIGTQLVCTNDAAAHVLMWHVVPVVLTVAVAAAVAAALPARPPPVPDA